MSAEDYHPDDLGQAERVTRSRRHSALTGTGHADYLANRTERDLRRFEMGDDTDD
ncbi:hypothetical protein [Microbacterium sp. NPDC058389]|uniref:hypothetical protein n=1 Tax=Microbacterium sp. NPDC058389 TaxID=3346475 RepID=UPI003668F40D